MKRIFLLLSLLSLFSLPPTFAQTPCVQGLSGIAPLATISFVAPATNSDGSALSLPLTYNIYQSTTSGLETKVASGAKGTPITISLGLTPRTTYYFKISVTDAGGNESALSNEVCKTFPASVPGAVTITIS